MITMRISRPHTPLPIRKISYIPKPWNQWGDVRKKNYSLICEVFAMWGRVGADTPFKRTSPLSKLGLDGPWWKWWSLLENSDSWPLIFLRTHDENRYTKPEEMMLTDTVQIWCWHAEMLGWVPGKEFSEATLAAQGALLLEWVHCMS